jgi:prolyl oligopeptidase
MKKLSAIILALVFIPTIMTGQKINYPVTDKAEQTDDYFGTKIQDPYRWLENDTAKNTEAWVREQNAVTNDYLSKIPFRDKIRNRLTEIWNYPKYGAPQKEGEWFTFYKNDGLQSQAVLYVQKGLNGTPEVLLDPNKLSSDGTIALQATSFSKTQQYFAYAVSASGSDWQEIYIMDFAERKLLSEKLEYVKFTSLSWAGNDGFYYSGYDKPKDEKTKFSAKTEYQKIFYHKAGTPQSADKLIYEDKDHPLRYVDARLTEDDRFLILNIAQGTDGSEIKVKDLHNNNAVAFTTIVEGFKTNAYVVENIGDKLLLKTNSNAPNDKLVLVDPKNSAEANWKTIIAEGKEPLEAVGTGGGKLFASYLKDATTMVNQYSLSGKLEHRITLPGVGTATGFGSRQEDDFFFYSYTSFTYPSTIFKYDIKTGKSELFRKSEVKFDPSAYETKQVFYPSKDGTKVPMFITYKKGIKPDGSNPTLLYGYGGFNINMTPAFSISNIPFFEAGGVYCVANLRGGAEYGEDWHKGGMLEKKQNVFDDFIAAAEWLIKEKYTSPAKLAIRGGSNGGLLVGACMAQRPDLFRVALPAVGVLDMLRYHKFTVGWGWAVEYGSSDYKDQFDYLIKYSPLHNLKKGSCYPATLITTADHDDRVVPAHSFKFAAALQEAQGCNNPTLIRIESKAGHGAGKPTAKVIDEAADVWSFVLYNMGLKF